MTNILLDTTYLVDTERKGAALETSIDDGDDVAIAAITVAELHVGVLLASGRARSLRSAFVQDVIDLIPIIDYDYDVARSHASLLAYVRRQGKPRGAHDLIIAASALATERTVVTADESGFLDLPGLTVRSHR